MKRIPLLIMAAVVLAIGWSGITDSGGADSSENLPARNAVDIVEYKAFKRDQIEELAPESSMGATDDLTHGLNALAGEGWRLVAIEPFHDEPRGRGIRLYPVTYVFERRK